MLNSEKVFSESFENYTDEKQAYSLRSEPTHKYTNHDAIVENQALHIKRNHSKQLLIMPEVYDFEFTSEIFYDKPPKLTAFDQWAWEVYFGYNQESRAGYKLLIVYAKEMQAVEMSYFKVEGVECKEIVKKHFSNIEVIADKKYVLSLSHYNGNTDAKIFGVALSMKADICPGIIAIAKNAGVTAIGFSKISVYSTKVPTSSVYKQSFTIPRTDGGQCDYYLQISVDKTFEKKPMYYISYKLTGGIYNNHDNMQSCDVWNREHDIFWGLYFSFGTDKLYIENAKLVFCDNSYGEFKKIISGEDIPYCGKFTLDEFEIPEKIFIGYDRRFSFCAGNQTSDRMFTYDSAGNLLFTGKSLNEPCFFNVSSNPDKEIVSRLPKDNIDYKDAVFHAQNNHYFINTENPVFRVDIYTKLSDEYLTFDAELQNAYFEKLKSLNIEKIDAGENIFCCYGYNKYSFSVACDVYDQGVYHMGFRCLYGTNILYNHVSAFEIFDDSLEESPQETAMLPMIFVGDGCAAKYAAYNLVNQKPDFNIMHYINCCLDTPGPAESRKTWELLHIYRRKLMIWMTKRGLINRNDTYKDYPGVIKNVDYLNYIYPGIEESINYFRYDLWKHAVFDSENVRKIYNSFIDENPDISSEFPQFDENGNVDEKKWSEISGESFDRLVTYINDKTEPLFEKQWNEIRTINPNVKRFAYGPYHVYTVDNSSAYDTKWFGFNKDGLSRVFDGGFMQLEDYPYACGYQTHRSAWNMMTIKQEWKDLKIAPELYDSFPPGCPDGATANAFPTDGESFIAPYQIVTQIYEYLYNTAIFEKGKFRYWDDKSLQIYEHISYEPEKRYECFLKSWKIHLDNKPAQTLKSTAFITEFDCSDDGRSIAIDTNAIFNKSQTAMCVIHEVNAQMGLPQGFVLKWDSLSNINNLNTDILVLPSLLKVGADIKKRIRELYNAGIALIATSDVSGLEDLFGVASQPKTEKISRIYYNDEEEYVYPSLCNLPYVVDDAKCVIRSDNNGIIYQKGRAMLINASLSEVGVDSFAFKNAGRANISKKIRAAIEEFMNSVARPIAHSESDCGIKIVKTEDGNTLVILTDYSPYSNEKSRTVNVWFDDLTVSKVENLSYDEHAINLNCFTNNGIIDGFSVTLRPREVLIFKVNTDNAL